MRRVQENLLGWGVTARSARALASNQLRHWSPDELDAIFRKVKPKTTGLQSLDLDPILPNKPSTFTVAKYFVNCAAVGFSQGFDRLKAPPGWLERSAQEGLALCVNVDGTFSLRKEGYYAVSHVWEEGIQAADDNSGVPRRTVRKIFERTQAIEAEWIWLDGLAIPGGNRSLTAAEERLKSDIINNLAVIYKNATAVIVFDALVMHLRSSDLVDVAVTLACGKWMTRVWTYQEIKIANKCLIMTGVGFIEFDRVLATLQRLEEAPNVARTLSSPTNYAKYRELKQMMLLLSRNDVVGISLPDIAMACYGRRTGNDIDYARALFPILGLTWRVNMTREEGMQEIFDSQRHHASRLIMMHGSPRSSFLPGWAPSYMIDLEGVVGEPMPWTPRGVKGAWFTYKVKESKPTKPAALLLELETSLKQRFLCGCNISPIEAEQTLTGFETSITNGTAFLLSRASLSAMDPTWAVNCLLVEQSSLSGHSEAWVYMTGAIGAVGENADPVKKDWLILHESPISTHDNSGKNGSELVYIIKDDLQKDGDLPLLIAAREGNVEDLCKLIKTGEAIEGRNKIGWTPLHAAASNGHGLIVEILIHHQANVNALTKQQKTPLILAAANGHNNVIKELLKANVDVNYSDNDHYSALYEAIQSNQLDTVRLLLEKGADPTGPDKFGFMPIIAAVLQKDASFVDLLIAAAANFNLKASSGLVGIVAAGRCGNAAAIDSLVKAGADVDTVEGNGPNTALYYATDEQHEEAVRMLLWLGADANREFNNRWTPIMLSARTGNFKIAECLLDAGAQHDARCQPEGWTALHIAAQNGRRVVVKLLKERGADVNAKDASGVSAAQLARAAGHDGIATFLIDRSKR